MQRKGILWIIWIVLLLTVLLWVEATPASVVTMESHHTMSVIITVNPEKSTTSYRLNPIEGRVNNGMVSYAAWDTEGNSKDTNLGDIKNYPADFSSWPMTSTIDDSGGTFLVTQNAKAVWKTFQSAEMFENLVGHGPAPQGSDQGIIQQYAENFWQMEFIARETGTYEFFYNNEYSGNFTLKQGEGSSYSLCYFLCQSRFVVGFRWEDPADPTGWDERFDREYLFHEEFSVPPIVDFNYPVKGSKTISFTQFLEKDMKIIFFSSESNLYRANTPVPAPASLLLLGTGLLGLGAAGWRRRRKG